MDRTEVTSRPKASPAAPDGEPVTSEVPRKIDRLAAIVDLCTEARQIAQDLEEPLLAYLLAMSIQETRACMRQQVAAAAGTVKLATRRAKTRRAPSHRP